jgi:hypothetical protein
MSPNHPLVPGTWILSVAGEQDSDDESDEQRRTGPNAIGRITDDGRFYEGQGWSYSVVFEPSGVWVFIDQADGLDDPTKFRLLHPC